MCTDKRLFVQNSFIFLRICNGIVGAKKRIEYFLGFYTKSSGFPYICCMSAEKNNVVFFGFKLSYV